LLADSDTGWHIRNGERILATGVLPHADPFSWSRPGAPWTAWEWGADVIMAVIYRASGLAGIAWMFGLLIAASVYFWFGLNRAVGGNFLVAGLFFGPMLPATAVHWLARPHIFSWLLLIGMVWLCERVPRRPDWPFYASVAIIAAVWANVHASFFFAPVIALIYAAGARMRPLIWNTRSEGRSRTYLLLALAACLGSLVNPNGWKLHQHVYSYLSDSGLLARITEYQSFDFHQSGGLQVMLVLFICSAGAFAALAAARPERFLLSVLLTAMALQSTRAIPLAALLVLPLANGSVTEILGRARDLAPALRHGLDAALGYGDRLQSLDLRFHGFALVPVAAILILRSIGSSAGFPASQFPVSAAPTIARLDPNARIFASDSFGGYLIYRFAGERKVFVDGRSDFYGADLLDRYVRMVEARPGWRAEFDRWHFTHALLQPESPLTTALAAGGWREIYRDTTAVVLAGPS